MKNPHIFPQDTLIQENKATGEQKFILKGGMTLLDYFAGQAMQALLSGTTRPAYDTAVKHSYAIAQSMLEEREKHL